MNKKIKIYDIVFAPSKIKNYIVIIAIGKKHYSEWKKYSSKLLIQYCKKNKIGLIVFKEFFLKASDYYSTKPALQKFLVGNFIYENLKFIKDICYLDTDILVNPFSPNIFDFHKQNKISVVSKYKNLPYHQTDNFIKRKVAFLRKNYYDKKFPLDSGLTMSRKQHFEFHGWKDQGDYFCSGLIMFNIKKYQLFFKKIFLKYQNKNFISMTSGDEPIFNYEVLKRKKNVNWLDYRFQVLWLYEVICKYPFLYEYKITDIVVKKCLESTLNENFFLHCSGKWPEGQMWKIKNIFSKNKQNLFKKFNAYLNVKLKSIPRKHISFDNYKKIV